MMLVVHIAGISEQQRLRYPDQCIVNSRYTNLMGNEMQYYEVFTRIHANSSFPRPQSITCHRLENKLRSTVLYSNLD
jgi:hypothetical protein